MRKGDLVYDWDWYFERVGPSDTYPVKVKHLEGIPGVIFWEECEILLPREYAS